MAEELEEVTLDDVNEVMNFEKEVSLDDLESGDFSDDPEFGGDDFKTEQEIELENAVPEESEEDRQNRIKFVKSLSPEYKAEMVFAAMQKEEGARQIVGHEKRLLLRKLARDAKKGKLDKYFLPAKK